MIEPTDHVALAVHEAVIGDDGAADEGLGHVAGEGRREGCVHLGVAGDLEGVIEPTDEKRG